MKKTILNSIHISLGAKMVSFGGFEMPIQYTGVKNEHITVRNSVGVFDVSHMGEFIVEGLNSLKLLQKICSNDIEKINVGKAQYNCLPNETGGIVDDLIVYRLKKYKYFLVVNASNIDKDWKWISKWNEQIKAKISNISDYMSLIAIQGPLGIKVAQYLSEADLNSLSYYSHLTTNFAGKENVLVATTGYTGSGGVEIFASNATILKVWDTLLEEGKDLEVAPIGLGARDTLRFEKGYALYGHELSEEIFPNETIASWAVKLKKESFVGKKAITDLKSPRKQYGVVLEKGGIPREGFEVFKEGISIGSVTSGSHSPSLAQGIALVMVNCELHKGDVIEIKVR